MSSQGSVRVRYAPSPTGYLHVGGVRTLLFNYLYAKKHNGKLILRIEDTDQARSTPENERMLTEDIDILGLTPDESPRLGGPHKPYRQSERLTIYGEYVKKLLDTDRAYHCFCPAEMIAQKREAALKLGRTPIYDGTCARLSKDEVKARLARGERAGIRFRAPNKNIVLQDAVRGEVEFKAGSVGDFLVARSPLPHEKEIGAGIGMPVYNFCCVIDDHMMGLTHIIRGEDHLANTARQLMLYEAFNFNLPIFAHTAMVLGSDRQKLSKRNGDTSARDYLNQGYLKETLINFLTFLGWHPKADQKNFKTRSGHPEILFFDELVQVFDLNGLQKAPAVFDMEKLKWMNTQYMRLLPLETIAERARPFFESSDDGRVREGVKKLAPQAYAQIVDLLRVDHGLLSDLPKAAAVFFDESPRLSDEAQKFIAEPSAKTVMNALKQGLTAMGESITTPQFEELQKKIGAELNVKGKSLFMPIRIALTGETHGPEIKKTVPLLGRTRALHRIEAIQKQMEM